MDQRSVENYLCSIPPFRGLPREVATELAAHSSLQRFTSRAIIFVEGEPAEHAYVVFSGRVAMIKSSPNGKELIIELVPAGNFFGVVALVDTKPYPLTARAQTECAILRLPRSKVIPILTEFPELQRGLINIITDRMQGAQNLARSLAHDCVESRVLAVINALLPIPANQAQGVAAEIRISRQEIADLTGITLETASRVVKGLERDGLVDASRVGAIVIPDVQAFHARL